MPTWRGWCALVVSFVLLFFSFLMTIHDFLAVQQPISGRVLVLEGWFSKRILKQTLRIFRAGDYDCLIALGGSINSDSFLSELYPDYENIADVSRDAMIEMGVAKNKVFAVPIPDPRINRTYTVARTLHAWLKMNQPEVRTVDVISKGPHARRTWLLFSLALGDNCRVGIYALKNTNYDAETWWCSSEGIKTVMTEMIGYLYTKFLFWPDN